MSRQWTLRNNKIGHAGCTALAEVIGSRAMASFKVLNFSNNQIGDAGCIDLAEVVRSGALAALNTLYINGNQFSDAAKEQLKAACQSQEITGSGF